MYRNSRQISAIYTPVTPYYRTPSTSPSNYSHIYKAYVNKVSLGAKISMFERVDFLAYIEKKLTVDRVQIANSFTFATVVASQRQKTGY